MGLLDSIGNILGIGGNNPSQGAFDPNDPRFRLANTDQLQRVAQNGMAQFGHPVAPVFNAAQPDQSRMQLQDALGLLRTQATGAAPSVAQNQLLQTTDRGIGQLAAALSMNRGANPGATARSLLGTGADMLQGANADAATLRAQEMNQGQNSLVNALNTLRGQDITQSMDAGQLQLYGQDQANNMLKYYTDLSRGVSKDNLDAALQLARVNTDYANNQNKAGGGLLGGLAGALAHATGLTSVFGLGGGTK